MNFIVFLKIIIPINFLAIYFLANVKNVYFLLFLTMITSIRLLKLVNKSYSNIPKDYKDLRNKYIPKILNNHYDKDLITRFIDSKAERARFMRKCGIIIIAIGFLILYIIDRLYGKYSSIYILKRLGYMLIIMGILWFLITIYYNTQSYKKYKEIYNEVGKEVEKFLVLKSALDLSTELLFILIILTQINKLK